MDVMGILNRELLHEKDLKKATGWIQDPSKCPFPDQAVAAARCWLTYRAIDGWMTLNDWRLTVARLKVTADQENHKYRWETSNAVADCYMLAKHGLLSNLQGRAIEYAFSDLAYRWVIWPPSLTNVIRLAAMAAQVSRCTQNKVLVKAIVDNIEPIYSKRLLDANPGPLLDTIAQAKAMLALKIIAKASGDIDFDCAPANPDATICYPGRIDFERSLYNIEIQSAAPKLWSESKLLKSLV